MTITKTATAAFLFACQSAALAGGHVYNVIEAPISIEITKPGVLVWTPTKITTDGATFAHHSANSSPAAGTVVNDTQGDVAIIGKEAKTTGAIPSVLIDMEDGDKKQDLQVIFQSLDGTMDENTNSVHKTVDAGSSTIIKAWPVSLTPWEPGSYTGTLKIGYWAE